MGWSDLIELEEREFDRSIGERIYSTVKENISVMCS